MFIKNIKNKLFHLLNKYKTTKITTENVTAIVTNKQHYYTKKTAFDHFSYCFSALQTTYLENVQDYYEVNLKYNDTVTSINSKHLYDTVEKNDKLCVTLEKEFNIYGEVIHTSLKL